MPFHRTWLKFYPNPNLTKPDTIGGRDSCRHPSKQAAAAAARILRVDFDEETKGSRKAYYLDKSVPRWNDDDDDDNVTRGRTRVRSYQLSSFGRNLVSRESGPEKI